MTRYIRLLSISHGEREGWDSRILLEKGERVAGVVTDIENGGRPIVVIEGEPRDGEGGTLTDALANAHPSYRKSSAAAPTSHQTACQVWQAEGRGVCICATTSPPASHANVVVCPCDVGRPHDCPLRAHAPTSPPAELTR